MTDCRSWHPEAAPTMWGMDRSVRPWWIARALVLAFVVFALAYIAGGIAIYFFG